MIGLSLRLLGAIFVGGALAALAHDLWRWMTDGRFVAAPLGQLWYDLHPPSIGLAQAVIQRYIWAALWDPGIVWLLTQPAAAALAAIGVAFLWLGRR